jgi:hypothetical protein
MEDRKQKLTFLDSKLAEKGYNPDDFVEFLDKKKMIRPFEIDNLSFNTLKDVLIRYII